MGEPRDIIKLAEEIAKKFVEKGKERYKNLVSLFFDDTVAVKPIDLGADYPIHDLFIRFHIIEPFDTPSAIYTLTQLLTKFLLKIKMDLEDLIIKTLKGENGELVIEMPRLLEVGPSMIAKAIKLRPIVLDEWVNSGYLSSILNDSAMKKLDHTSHIHVGLMLDFIYSKRQPINNMYKAIYNKVRRMKTPKCERAPAFDMPPPAWLPPSAQVRTYTYVCHEELEFRKYETYLTMMIYSDDILHGFLIQADGAKLAVINTLREIDKVFTNQVFKLVHPLPFEPRVIMLPIYWAISEGDLHE
jgi:hypothetical protein